VGGIANISIGDSAFDVCVCNMALNWLASRAEPSLDYDAHGQLAEKGAVSQDLLEGLESIEWYQTPPPRSLGAEWFEEQLRPILNDPSLSIENRLATYCRHIALRIRDSLKSSKAAGEILITGGGAHNLHLFNELKHEFASIGVVVQVAVDREVIDFKEALSFAYLGWLTLQGKFNTMPSVTGARRAAVSGSIHLPSVGGFHLSKSDS
jgi:anhydro-N-acetylmuramic acid kinase